MILTQFQDEVTAVESMREVKDSDPRTNRIGHRLSKQRKSTNAEDIGTTSQDGVVDSFQISTCPDGYNSGRCYYLKADSLQSCEMLVDILLKLVSVARARAEGASKFQQSQQVARAIYDSSLFQASSSLLIVLVRTINSVLYELILP
jgi:hypothetical protein